MNFIKVALFACLSVFMFDVAEAQNRQYHIYADTDNNTTSGCDVNWPGLGSSIAGIEQRFTVTTDSQLPPNIISTQVHACQGNAFGAGSAVGQAAIGLNTGGANADVFEMSINRSQLGINQSGNVLFYFASDSNAAADVVLSGNGGGPIFFGFAFPVPTLGWLGLAFLISLLLFISRKNLNKHIKTSAVLILLTTTAWAMTIIIDGQTNDWGSMTAAANDPVGDTDGTGSYADITAIFLTKQDDQMFFRMDVVDVENQAPIANSTSDSTLEEQAVTITLTGSDAEGAAITFSQGTAPANGSLSNFTVVNNTTSTVDYTPDVDFAGNDTFTVVANDGQVNSAPATISVTVNPINDAPSFTSGGNVNVLKTAGPYSQTWATAISAGPTDEAGQNLTFNITANDNAAIFTQQPAIDANGLLTFTGVNNATGTANLTVELMDDGGTANGGMDTSAAVNFSITLQGVNDEPSFTIGTNQTVNEDAGAQTVVNWATNILAGPADESGQTLTFNVINNSNAALFSTGPTVAADGTLSYTTAADANGSATITIELMDDGGTANGGDDTSPAQSFDITVNSVNDAPSFTAGSNQSVLEGAGAQTVNNWATSLSAGPADESGQTLNFNVSNDNNALFTVQPSIDASGNLTYTPEGSTLGSATVTVSLSDNGGVANGGIDTSANQTFTISVTQVNDEPSFTIGADQTVNEDAGAQTVAGWATNVLAGPPDESGQNVTFNVIGNTNAALFSAGPAVAADGTLSYTTAADANGSATITIELMDDGGTANGGDDTSPAQSFDITVNAVNDVPEFTSGGDVVVFEDSGAYMMSWASAISPGPVDEAAQNVSFNISNDNNALFSVQPTLSTAGDLTFTVSPDASGMTTVTVSLMDDGGVANGGTDTSASQMFTITIADVNDQPSFTVGADQTVNENSGNQVVANWATNLSAGPANEAGQTLSFTVTNNSNAALFSAGPAVASNGTLTFTPTADLFGTATVTIELMDDGGTSNGGDDTSPSQSFMIEVLEANTPPTVTAPGPFYVNANIGIDVPDGTDDLLAGANDADPSDTLSISGTGNMASAQGGAVIINTATGTFEYQPPAGFTGTDSFDYQVCDNGIPQECTAATTVTLDVDGPPIWFIDNNAAAGGDGTYSAPFESITAYNNADPSAGNDRIFLASSATDYSGNGLTLKSTQMLIGQGGSDDFGAMMGIAIATYSYTPPVQSTRPVITSTNHAIILGNVNVIRGLNIGDTSGYAIAGSPLGTTVVLEVSIMGAGGALMMTGIPNFDATFTSISSTNHSDHVIILSGATGNLTVVQAGTGITHNSIMSAISITNSSLNFQYPGNITNNSGSSIEISNQSSGTVTFTGTIDDNGAGVHLSNNTGGTINFNGQLDLNTTINTAFSATNGGTVNITGSNNTITTSTGSALLVRDTNIGLNNLNFQSISAGSGAYSAGNAITLENTGTQGGLIIQGPGNSVGSGGTIQNKDIGIRLLNTQQVQLNGLQMSTFFDHAVDADMVLDLTVSNATINGINGNTLNMDTPIDLSEVTGTINFNGVNVSGGISDQMRLINNTGTATLNIQDGAQQAVFGLDANPASGNGNDSLLVNALTTADITLNITGADFIGARGDLVQTIVEDNASMTVNINNSTFNNAHVNSVGGGITLTGGSLGSNILASYNVSNSNFSGAISNAITANFVTPSGAGAVNGLIDSNTIGIVANQGSGSQQGSGILVGSNDNISHTVTINNNQVVGIAGNSGIETVANSNANFKATITNNVVAELSGFALAGMYNLLGGNGTETGEACLDIRNNFFDATAVNFGQAIYHDQISQSANYNLPGYSGSPNGELSGCPNGTASTDVNTHHVNNSNTLGDGAGVIYLGTNAELVCGMTGTGSNCL